MLKFAQDVDEKGRGSSNLSQIAKACSKAMKLLARSSSMLLNSVQLFLILAQFGFQILQTFAQNCLKLVRCCYDWQ